MKKIILLAFLLRIVVALLGEHGDVISYYWWSKDLLDNGLMGFYDRNIANAMRPTYPPVTSYLFFADAVLHQTVLQLSWFLNLHIPIFPSNFIFWLESPKGWYFFNKLPAILADLGITLLLFKFGKNLKDKKTGYFSAAAFAFLPPFWYNSSLWGQTDSIYAFSLLASFYSLHKKRPVISIILFVLSLLTKPTGAFVLPIYLVWWLTKTSIKTFVLSVIVLPTEVLLLYFPFHQTNLVLWIIQFYRRSLGGELSYIVANAFNLWALIFGFDNRPDTTLLFSVPTYLIGDFLFSISAILSMWFIFKKRPNTPAIILLGAILSFSAFLFLPRMHERYFYPTLVFLTLSAGLNTKLRSLFFCLALINIINMYHFWWVPWVHPLVLFFSLHIVERLLIISNMALFVLLIKRFNSNYPKFV